MFLKLKLFFQRRDVGNKYQKKIKKNGHLLFKKRQQIIVDYLGANKKGNDLDEKYYKGFLDCIEWLIN